MTSIHHTAKTAAVTAVAAWALASAQRRSGDSAAGNS